MSYQDLLSPWAIDRLLPNAQRQRVAQFRKRTEAEEYLKIIQQLLPDARFEIVYEVGQNWRQMPASDTPRVDSVPLAIKICKGTEQDM